MRRLLSVFDLPHGSLESFCKRARVFRDDVAISDKREFVDFYIWRSVLNHRFLGTIFAEPSIRTRWSFEVGMQKLGGNVVSSFGPQSTSAEKGESLIDMLQTAATYVDAIVIRTPEKLSSVEDEHLFDFENVDAHIINAGDGKHEHPTQAMLDAFTIWDQLQQLDSLNFVIVGDVTYSRTIHSLLALLGTKELDNRFHVWDYRKEGLGEWEPEAEVIMVENPDQIKDALRDCDVLYLNRVQGERQIGGVVNPFYLNEDTLKNALNGNAIILNPGPRRDEMPDVVLEDNRCKYWHQMQNGLYMRMAILYWIFTGHV